jgi:hypothetical protein
VCLVEEPALTKMQKHGILEEFLYTFQPGCRVRYFSERSGGYCLQLRTITLTISTVCQQGEAEGYRNCINQGSLRNSYAGGKKEGSEAYPGNH